MNDHYDHTKIRNLYNVVMKGQALTDEDIRYLATAALLNSSEKIRLLNAILKLDNDVWMRVSHE